ncbi:ClC family H(+)/Cl(-) exchange transporter [Paenibacillus tianjinensis]|uniref:ClC family H(+)/Cl(-) exchange transporter n=1 Tax=Paenibacillus tianjinensis TaxID=2810347 RepID=A0ABX7LI57_9BACL|nr:ClC family H(+)/Cl(-) exchange transporter [Paenibacillus tianjinensis]QSF46634.1 ClC family H(+)/Cl(-) exchange transporter [Paenibacillus tianjinensis]
MSQHSIRRLLDTWFDFKFRLLAGGIAVGVLSGTVVVLFRFVLEEALKQSLVFYQYQKNHMWLVPVWLAVLVIAGWGTGMLVKKQPGISGSGIPQVKAVLQNRMELTWWKALSAKFVGGAVSIGAGLSLGREGPSIQIGALVAEGFSRLLRKSKTETQILITCGASAGLSAAFNAPIAGVIFALEEVHMNFSPLIMISALTSSLVADFVSKEFFGLTPVFNFSGIGTLPLLNYYHLVLLGILVGVSGILFNKGLYFFQDLYPKISWIPSQARPVVPFILAGVLGLTLPSVLGGGNGLVNQLVSSPYSFSFLLLLLAVKFLFTMVSYGSSAPGGIFLPMLVIGGLIGTLYCQIANGLMGGTPLDESYFLIVAMAGFLTASLKAPITGIILITEMTGSFTNLLPIGIVCLAAYMTAEAFRSLPVYEVLLERFLNGKSTVSKTDSAKVILEIPVHQGSMLDGISIGAFQWPAHCLIVSVKRGAEEIIPSGRLVIHAGDSLVILTSDKQSPIVLEKVRQVAHVSSLA